MFETDEQNIQLLKAGESVDSVNAKFYGRFQYPWRPLAFDQVMDPDFETITLNQTIGSWDHSHFPRNPRVWVAGCGTNQAVFTALRFPGGTVLGSDLSETSLDTAASTARMLGVSNLQLKQESLNDIPYKGEFDYVLCTGVIHHNANPAATLSRLAESLKPDGLLELMVYNRAHRALPVAFQKAMGLLGNGSDKTDFTSKLGLAKNLIQAINTPSEMTRFLEHFKQCSEAELADVLLQPIEHSFTLSSFLELLQQCGLEIVAPCINIFDKARDTYFWNMEFSDATLQDHHDELSDVDRWQLANYLLFDKSPMLWFYVKRSGQAQSRKSEKQMAQEFLDRKFVATAAKRRLYYLQETGEYKLMPAVTAYPGKHPKDVGRQILAQIAARPDARMCEVLQDLKLGASFQFVNRLRLQLTTNAFPFLRSQGART
jgi:2-polyprenyl-3-methyl-5-hydroxy-6-metoxy-1,4-benzoquinol methylase